MKHPILFIGLILVFASGLSAQSIDRFVVSNGGQTTDASGLYLDYTIGEPMTETVESGGLIITHGMQQPDLIVVRIHENQHWSDWKVFPNPVRDVLRIAVPAGYQKVYSYTVTGRHGKRCLQGFGCFGDQEINLKTLPSGQYFLTLIADNLRESVTFKIIKVK